MWASRAQIEKKKRAAIAEEGRYLMTLRKAGPSSFLGCKGAKVKRWRWSAVKHANRLGEKQAAQIQILVAAPGAIGPPVCNRLMNPPGRDAA